MGVEKENEIIMNIKYWFSDIKDKWNHNRNANRINSEASKKHYKPKTNSIIKILSELDNEVGLSPYNIVPFLIKIKLMNKNGLMFEKGNDKLVTDRERNTELFSELEQLKFIRIIENKLYSFHNGRKFPTPIKECVLRVKLLPKGIDYLIEHRKRKKDYRFAYITIVLLFITAIFSIPQFCNNWEQYQILKNTKKDKDISESKSNIKENNSQTGKIKEKLENRKKTELEIKPILEATKH